MLNHISTLKKTINKLSKNKVIRKKDFLGVDYGTLVNIGSFTSIGMMIIPIILFAMIMVYNPLLLLIAPSGAILLRLLAYIEKKYVLAKEDFFLEIEERISHLILNTKENLQEELIELSKDFLLIDRDNTLESELLVIHEKLKIIEHINKEESLKMKEDSKEIRLSISSTLERIQNDEIDILKEISKGVQ